MTVETSQTSDEITVAVYGDLDLTTVASFHSAVSKAIEAREGRKLIVDLRGTNYIDSAGLEQLLVGNRKLAALGDRLKVRVKPGSQPATVLEITGFGAVIDVEPVAGSA